MILNGGVLHLGFGCVIHHYPCLSHHEGGVQIVCHGGDVQGIPDEQYVGHHAVGDVVSY